MAYIRLAAQLEQPEAQSFPAAFYAEDGNKKRALEWVIPAAEQGDEASRNLLDQLENGGL